MKKIGAEVYEVALDKEREEFFGSMKDIYKLTEQVAVEHGIPLETFDNLWEEFTSALDNGLIENFSLDRNGEDV